MLSEIIMVLPVIINSQVLCSGFWHFFYFFFLSFSSLNNFRSISAPMFSHPFPTIHSTALFARSKRSSQSNALCRWQIAKIWKIVCHAMANSKHSVPLKKSICHLLQKTQNASLTVQWIRKRKSWWNSMMKRFISRESKAGKKVDFFHPAKKDAAGQAMATGNK